MEKYADMTVSDFLDVGSKVFFNAEPGLQGEIVGKYTDRISRKDFLWVKFPDGSTYLLLDDWVSTRDPHHMWADPKKPVEKQPFYSGIPQDHLTRLDPASIERWTPILACEISKRTGLSDTKVETFLLEADLLEAGKDRVIIKGGNGYLVAEEILDRTGESLKIAGFIAGKTASVTDVITGRVDDGILTIKRYGEDMYHMVWGRDEQLFDADQLPEFLAGWGYDPERVKRAIEIKGSWSTRLVVI